MRTRIINKPSDVSAFLGIATGKQARAKAAAAIAVEKARADAALLLETAKRDTLTLQLAQAKAGFDPVKDAAAAEITKTEITASSTNNLYYVIGAIVVVVMIGLYFITKKN